MGGRGWAGWSGVGGEWDNCNSIINKYIKKIKKLMIRALHTFKQWAIIRAESPGRPPASQMEIFCSFPLFSLFRPISFCLQGVTY